MIRWYLAILLINIPIQSSEHTYAYFTLNYETPSDCFETGIKRVFVPFPGFGTFACLKDAIVQLPNAQKSGSLIAGHMVGLLGAGLTSTFCLMLAEYLDIPGAKEIIGPELSGLLKTKKFDNCRDF
ncbi:hypothetical protein BH09DEP1_BH09DEP1_1880 [soil metagenome]